MTKHLERQLQLSALQQAGEHKYTGFVTEYEVGMSDLEDKLFELCEGVRQSPPDPFPQTVGQFIYEIGKVTTNLP
jgi:hypothetical protein